MNLFLGIAIAMVIGVFFGFGVFALLSVSD